MTNPDGEALVCPLENILGIPLEEAFDLVHKTAHWLTRGHAGNAEDLTHDVLEKLNRLAKEGRLHITGQVEPFLIRTTEHQFIDQHVRRRRIIEVAFEPHHDREDESRGPERLLVDAEISRLLEAGIAGLSEDHQDIIRLRFFEGLSLEQIATRLSLRKSTVQSREKAAYKDLRNFLRRHSWKKES